MIACLQSMSQSRYVASGLSMQRSTCCCCEEETSILVVHQFMSRILALGSVLYRGEDIVVVRATVATGYGMSRIPTGKVNGAK